MYATALAYFILFTVGFQLAGYAAHGVVGAVKALKDALGAMWNDPVDDAVEGFLEGVAEPPDWIVLLALTALVWGAFGLLVSAA